MEMRCTRFPGLPPCSGLLIEALRMNSARTAVAGGGATQCSAEPRITLVDAKEKMVSEVDFSQLQPDDEFLSDLGADVWLMDDHRWALLVWTRFGLERGIERFSLVHADHHWDGVNDFHEREAERARLQAADLAEIEAMVRNKEFIQCDSFIAPAVIRKLVTEVHFFCTQMDTEAGLGEKLLIDTGAREYMHYDAGQLAKVQFNEPVIFDLCLDLFNRTNKWATGISGPTTRLMAFSRAFAPSSNMLSL